MPDPSGAETDEPDAWELTLSEMRDLATELEVNGWETVSILAKNTAPEPPDTGQIDCFGFVYTVPGNVVDEFRDVYDGGTFDSSTVYRR